MEVRIPQMKELQGPIAAPPADTPSPPPAPLDDAPVPLSSGEESSDDEDFEFEFPFVSRESPAGTAAPADELFADGRIRPFYPVFGGVVSGGVGGCVHASAGGHDGTARSVPVPAVAPRVRGQLGRLFLEETRARNSSTSSTASTASSSSSAATDDDRADGLEGAAPESYCVWRPGSASSASPASSPRPPRKSGSTGSMARWRRISDLVVGRSHSDGKEKFLFFAAPPHEQAPKDKDKPKPKPSPAPAGGRKPTPVTTEVDTVTAAHRIAYLSKGGGTAGGTPRRTFLPYREELVGFFANVNGVSRSHQHPF
ncbi:hypothetical protein SEVIR_3G136500v4 [Setaria viridis]|uniref:DUF1645 domain-containing protein n=2 Tax=Setaria TaxID=4554 RepID=K3Z862_SETIT|nr:uncharacterized protein LOC101769981 [Setaria italica]XP_034585091.1 uncharacterized protein LOC117847899 [Setaria viridis]RCV16401.1 hypothetical protein SETIT_3G134900v2 [Setaria italica]TKW25719.1 hypothetical protein SEVIR_3G136500v2 [Setaria viridis]